MLDTLSRWFPLLLEGTAHTLFVAASTFFIGITGGLICGVIQCKTLKKPIISSLIHLYVLCMRGTPLFIQVLFIYYSAQPLFNIALSPLAAGIIALGINSTAYVTEIIRAGIDSLPMGQWEASYVLGLSVPRTLLCIILPQAIRNMLPALLSETVNLIKESSILAVIGVMELTKVGKLIVARDMDPAKAYLIVGGIYLVITSLITSLAHYFEQEDHQ